MELPSRRLLLTLETNTHKTVLIRLTGFELASSVQTKLHFGLKGDLQTHCKVQMHKAEGRRESYQQGSGLKIQFGSGPLRSTNWEVAAV